MELNPKFKLWQELVVRTLNINLPVIITKRIAVINVDDGSTEYQYNFKHITHISDYFTWDNVSEEALIEMIWEAEQYKERG